MTTPEVTIDVYNIYRPPTRQSEDGERVDLFTMDAFPTSPNVFAMGDINGHHPEWDVNCSDPDGVGRRVHEWLAANRWTTLNSGAATCVGYGNRTRQTAPDVTMCHRDLARRCTWSLWRGSGQRSSAPDDPDDSQEVTATAHS